MTDIQRERQTLWKKSNRVKNREKVLAQEKAYRTKNREKVLESTRRWRERNQAHIKSYQAQYLLSHPKDRGAKAKYDRDRRAKLGDLAREANRASYRRHATKRKAYQKRYRSQNPDKIKTREKLYYGKNSDRLRAKSRQYSIDNHEKVTANNLRWQRQNPDKVRAGKRRYEQSHKADILAKRRERVRNNPDLRLRIILRRRISLGIRKAGGRKSDTTQSLTGCSYLFLRGYIEARWKEGMSWENYGLAWHIDHRMPLSRFNLLDVAEQRKCFHYSNLQPLWAVENLRKGDKLPETHQAELI